MLVDAFLSPFFIIYFESEHLILNVYVFSSYSCYKFQPHSFGFLPFYNNICGSMAKTLERYQRCSYGAAELNQSSQDTQVHVSSSHKLQM